jgi:hypothetical protein
VNAAGNQTKGCYVSVKTEHKVAVPASNRLWRLLPVGVVRKCRVDIPRGADTMIRLPSLSFLLSIAASPYFLWWLSNSFLQ